MAASSNDKVGYGRPPKASRFQPGQSGNPTGRRNGQRNLKTDLAEELGEIIRIREGDQERAVTKQRALIKALLAKALKGDARAASLLFGLIATHVEAHGGTEPDDEVAISAADHEIIDNFLRRSAGAALSKEGADE